MATEARGTIPASVARATTICTAMPVWTSIAMTRRHRCGRHPCRPPRQHRVLSLRLDSGRSDREPLECGQAHQGTFKGKGYNGSVIGPQDRVANPGLVPKLVELRREDHGERWQEPECQQGAGIGQRDGQFCASGTGPDHLACQYASDHHQGDCQQLGLTGLQLAAQAGCESGA